MKTTTSSSMRVKARRDAWDIGGAGRKDSSSIGFDTLSHVDDEGLGQDAFKAVHRLGSRNFTQFEGRQADTVCLTLDEAGRDPLWGSVRGRAHHLGGRRAGR